MFMLFGSWLSVIFLGLLYVTIGVNYISYYRWLPTVPQVDLLAVQIDVGASSYPLVMTNIAMVFRWPQSK